MREIDEQLRDIARLAVVLRTRLESIRELLEQAKLTELRVNVIPSADTLADLVRRAAQAKDGTA